jgi:glycerol kinase
MPVVTGKYGPLVGAIDEGTSSARFLVSNKFQTFSEEFMVTTITSSQHQRN